MEFMVRQALVLVPILWIVGAVIKNTPFIPDWLIPYILLVLGALGGLAVVSVDGYGVMQGIFAAGLSVLGHQLVKQTSKAFIDTTEEAKK